MTATIVGSSSATARSGTITLPKPSGVAAGDVLIAVLRQEVTNTTTLPAGWQALTSQNGATFNVFWKALDGTEGTSFGFGLSGAFNWYVMSCIAVRGANTAAPFRNGLSATGIFTGSPLSSFVTPSQPSALANALVGRVAVGTGWPTSQTGTAPSTVTWGSDATPRVTAYNVNNSVTPSFVSIATHTQAADGATGTRTARIQDATPADRTASGHAVTFEIAEPASSAPTNTTAPVVTGTAAVGAVLTVARGAWSGTPTSFSYQWQRDGASISGATAQTYTVTTADTGHTLRCVETATNGIGSSSANSNAVSIPTAPVNTTAPVIGPAGTVRTGDVLSLSTPGVYTGGVDTRTYQWFRGPSPISGETNPASYIVQQTDEGATLSLQETATNGGGSSTANSNTVTPAVTAPISDASFLAYYSGGATNSDPALSIGGARGGTYTASLNSLVGPIPGSVAQNGGVIYRVVYIRNTHTTATAAGLRLFIETQFADRPDTPDLQLAVAVPDETANQTVPALASGTSAPTGRTWITATDPAAGAPFGDLGPGAYRGVYLRFTVPAGVKLDTAGSAWGVAVEGTAA